MIIDIQGYACFVCKTDEDFGQIGGQKTVECPCCSPTVILDLSQGQHILEHIAAHILYDPGVVHVKGILCGLCLHPSPLSILSHKRNLHVNSKASRDCLVKINYLYCVAVESSTSSPCSNVSIQFSICLKSEPVIWKYFVKIHLKKNTKIYDPLPNASTSGNCLTSKCQK